MLATLLLHFTTIKLFHRKTLYQTLIENYFSFCQTASYIVEASNNLTFRRRALQSHLKTEIKQTKAKVRGNWILKTDKGLEIVFLDGLWRIIVDIFITFLYNKQKNFYRIIR
jgi:hypothetical protein